MFKFSKYNLKEPLIHIGFPRSASTWLQSNLFQPDYGFLQIMNPISVELNLIDPPVFAFEPEKVLEFLEKKVSSMNFEEIKNELTPVITSEVLSGKPFTGGHNAKEMADRLKLIFPDGKILIIIREQNSMILSLYDLMIRWRLPHSLKQFLNPIHPRLVPQFNYAYLKYDRIVSYYYKVFKQERVLVLPFEQFKSEPKSFIKSIYEFVDNLEDLEGRLNNLPFNVKSNPSLGSMRLIFRRWINYTFASGAFNYSGLIKNKKKSILFKYIDACQQIAEILPEFVNQYTKNSFTKYIEKETLGKFEESNRKLADLIKIDLSKYGYKM